MIKKEVCRGKVRNNIWKWKKEIDDLVVFYKNKSCECGCGNKLKSTRKQIRDSRYKGKKLRVIKGHHNKLREAKKWLLRGKKHPQYGKKRELSPAWKGGSKKRTDYGKGWETARRKTLKRDDNTCQSCKRNKIQRRIDVHHIIPFKKFDNFIEANNLDNLISLCYKCHQIKEWELRFKEKYGVNSVKVPTEISG